MENQGSLKDPRSALQSEANRVSFERAKQLAAEQYEMEKEKDKP